MKILAIDTSNKPLSVAVLEDQELLAEITTNAQRNHSITLMPLIKEVLQRANVKVADLDRIAVAQGPGSYTGLRIGVTTAKTLAFTLNKELVGVSSLKTLAAAYPNTEALLVPVFDARRENVFAAAYQWQAGHLVEVIAEGHYAFANLCQRLADFNQKVIFIGRDSQNFAEISFHISIPRQFEYIFYTGRDFAELTLRFFEISSVCTSLFLLDQEAEQPVHFTGQAVNVSVIHDYKIHSRRDFA